jgi:hypothetical protein
MALPVAIGRADSSVRVIQSFADAPKPRQPLDEVLKSAGAYVDAFPVAAAGAVREESYSQQLHAIGATRHLRSDILIVPDRDNGWLEFRDVFEVDGKPVRDRTDRLVRLFATPTSDAAARAARIVAEGARFNLDPLVNAHRVSRTINIPTLSMWILRSPNQHRFTFHRGRDVTVRDREAVALEFKESAKPRLIATNNEAPAHGQFWIDVETGAVLRSELALTNDREDMRVDANITVDYTLDAGTAVWLPHAMEEHYEISTRNSAYESSLPTRSLGVNQPYPPNITVNGQATYSNVRHFSVTVGEQPAPSPSQAPAGRDGR